MLITTSSWQEKPSFKMIPVTLDCPYQEVIFIPGERMIVIISKVSKKSFTMTNKLDSNGQRFPIYGKGADKAKIIGFKQERVELDSYAEYYLEDKEEILDFIELFARNYTSWTGKLESFLTLQEAPPGEITLAGPLPTV